jgi:outer membrane protein assembly factor BamB
VTDGERIYVFFGKTGALAFDLKGNQLWKTNLGSGSDKQRWGSATSPALSNDMVFINAWDENKTLFALDKRTGREMWKKDLSQTGLTFATPVLADAGDGRSELIVSAPKQVWGLDPKTGQQFWFARTDVNDSVIPTPVVLEGVAYIHGGGPRQRGSLAVRLGGQGDVTDTHIVWRSQEVASPPSPVVVDGLIYWVDGAGKACCMDARTGALRYSEKLPVTGRFAVYASAVAAGGRLYIVTRKSGTFVLPAQPKYEILAHNQFASDDSDFNGSPAISNRRMLLRSNRSLYCIEKAR